MAAGPLSRQSRAPASAGCCAEPAAQEEPSAAPSPARGSGGTRTAPPMGDGELGRGWTWSCEKGARSVSASPKQRLLPLGFLWCCHAVTAPRAGGCCPSCGVQGHPPSKLAAGRCPDHGPRAMRDQEGLLGCTALGVVLSEGWAQLQAIIPARHRGFLTVTWSFIITCFLTVCWVVNKDPLSLGKGRLSPFSPPDPPDSPSAMAGTLPVLGGLSSSTPGVGAGGQGSWDQPRSWPSSCRQHLGVFWRGGG